MSTTMLFGIIFIPWHCLTTRSSMSISNNLCPWPRTIWIVVVWVMSGFTTTVPGSNNSLSRNDIIFSWYFIIVPFFFGVNSFFNDVGNNSTRNLFTCCIVFISSLNNNTIFFSFSNYKILGKYVYVSLNLGYIYLLNILFFHGSFYLMSTLIDWRWSRMDSSLWMSDCVINFQDCWS